MTQFHDHCYITDVTAVLSHLSACVDDLNLLCSSLCLQLNPGKAEFIWFGSRSTWPQHLLNTWMWHLHPFIVSTLCTVLVLYLTQNYPWSHTSVKLQVLVFFHLRRLQQLQNVVTDEVMKTVSDVTGSQQIRLLWLCAAQASGIQFGTSAVCAERGCLACPLKLDHRSPIKPPLQSLHWLPVKGRIEFKIATMMPPLFFINAVLHISVTLCNSGDSVAHMTTNAAVVVMTRIQFGKRVFPVCSLKI